MHEINVRSFSAETQVLQASRNESRLDPSAETSTSSRRTSDESQGEQRPGQVRLSDLRYIKHTVIALTLTLRVRYFHQWRAHVEMR